MSGRRLLQAGLQTPRAAWTHLCLRTEPSASFPRSGRSPEKYAEGPGGSPWSSAGRETPRADSRGSLHPLPEIPAQGNGKGSHPMDLDDEAGKQALRR